MEREKKGKNSFIYRRRTVPGRDSSLRADPARVSVSVAPESFFLLGVAVRGEAGNRGEPGSRLRSHPESSVGAAEISE